MKSHFVASLELALGTGLELYPHIGLSPVGCPSVLG